MENWFYRKEPQLTTRMHFTSSLVYHSMMKQLSTRLVFIVAFLAFVLAKADAQPLSKSTIEDMINVAEEQLEANRPYNALEWFKKAYDEEPTAQLAYRMAELNYQLRDYDKAVNYFERAMRKAADGDMVEGLFYLGRSQKMRGNYAEALDALREFKRMAPGHELTDRADLEIEGAQMAIEMNEPPRIKVDNAGRSVNTSNQEYSPVLASDGNLYYAGYGVNGYVMEEGEKAANIRLYSSKAGEDGTYGKGIALPKALNRDGYQTVNVAVSSDGNSMLFVRSLMEGASEVESKIYFASKGSGDRWGSVEEVARVNGKYIAKHPAFGELFGNEVMYFSANMSGGEGGYDLYYATKRGEGQYDAPVNLGPAINTPFDDITPYYTEGTLYFSTDGRPTLGGFDVFRSEWSGESWSEPVNMGKGFNSSYDDRYFQLDKTGKMGVLTSNRPPTRSVKSKTCCDDVFVLNVEPIISNLLVTTLDNDGQLLPEVTIDLAELSDGDTTVISRKLNPQGNRFDFELVDDKNYVLIARRDGYEPSYIDLNTLGFTKPENLERTLVLTASKTDTGNENSGDETIELTLNQPIRLANIYYDFDDDKILPSAEPDLQYITDLLIGYPEMVIELGSHTDAQGKDSYNEILSQRRAQSAVDWIVGRGITRERLVAKGYGESNILNQCVNGVKCDDDDHRFNRRTEFKILEGPQTIQVKKMTKTRQVPDRGSMPMSAPQGYMSMDTLKPATAGMSRAAIKKQGVGVAAMEDQSVDSSPVVSASPSSAEVVLPKRYNDEITDDLSSLYYEKDLTGVPILTWDERRIDFGTVKKGEKREHTYHFTNTSNIPASIAIVSACSCTTLDWTKTEIGPGDSGMVHAIFDSSEKDAGELIVIDVILDQEAASGNGIIERVQYNFELEK